MEASGQGIGTDPSRVRQAQVRLRILATSDLHMHIQPHDYVAAAPSLNMGLARTAGLIARARAGAANHLLFDNGDFLQGSALGDHAAATWRPGAGAPHPMIAAMNLIGYDAVGLGNHDFNYGLAFLRGALAGAAFPVVASNAVVTDGLPLAHRALVLDRRVVDGAGRVHPLRVGVLSLLPPQTAAWDRHVLAGGLETPDIVATAAEVVPELRAAGADLIVALAHTGIGRPDALPGQENAATALAAAGGIDAIVAGHSHLVFPCPLFPAAHPSVDPRRGRLSGVPAVMPGALGSHLGIIDLVLDRRADGRWQVTAARSRAQPLAVQSAGRLRARAAPAPAVLAATARIHGETVAELERELCRNPRPLDTHFARVADVEALRLIAAALADHARDRLAGRPEAGLPVLAAVAPFRAGGRAGPENFTAIPAGPLRQRHVLDLYAFANEFRAVRVTGAILADWLERSAAMFRPIAPGARDAPLIDPAFPSYNFDVIAGLTYSIDPSAPPRFDVEGRVIDPGARRLRDLRRNGRPVGPEERFVVATNSYRVASCPALSIEPGAALVLSERVQCRDILRDWLAGGGAAPAGPGWRLALPAGATALFDTSPAADPGALAGSGLRAERLGQTTAGFLRLRLSAGA